MLRNFHAHCLSTIFNCRSQDLLKHSLEILRQNKSYLQACHHELNIIEHIQRRRWNYIGNILRKPNDHLPKLLFQSAVQHARHRSPGALGALLFLPMEELLKIAPSKFAWAQYDARAYNHYEKIRKETLASKATQKIARQQKSRQPSDRLQPSHFPTATQAIPTRDIIVARVTKDLHGSSSNPSNLLWHTPQRVIMSRASVLTPKTV